MEHVKNLFKDSKNLDVIVKGTVTGKHVNSQDEVLYQVETPCGDCFEADERCVFEDITKPVEVPQYVADWYEGSKVVLDYAIWDVIQSNAKGNVLSEELNNWIENTEDAIIILVKMHLFGYKVKKDKKYLVKLIQGGQYLHTDHSGETLFTAFSQSIYTKKELKELDLEWVFDCPGIKLEEVE